MKTKATFKQIDVKRAIKAVQEAGLEIRTVEITRDGTIRVLTSEQPEVRAEQQFEL